MSFAILIPFVHPTSSIPHLFFFAQKVPAVSRQRGMVRAEWRRRHIPKSTTCPVTQRWAGNPNHEPFPEVLVRERCRRSWVLLSEACMKGIELSLAYLGLMLTPLPPQSTLVLLRQRFTTTRNRVGRLLCKRCEMLPRVTRLQAHRCLCKSQPFDIR